MERLEIGDFLLAAQTVTGIDAHVLAKNPRTMEQAEAALAVPWAGFGEVEVYPTLQAKAAAYAAAIVRYTLWSTETSGPPSARCSGSST